MRFKPTVFSATLLSLIAGVFLAGCSPQPKVPEAAPAVASGPVIHHGVFTYVDGDVQVQTGGAWTEADIGLKVSQASVVKTGPGAVCDLQFGRLGTLHLSENTVVAGVRGTRFLVSRTGSKTSVAVAEGLVALVPPADAEAVQKALGSAPSVGPGREAGVTRAGEDPVIGPVGEANRKVLEQTASMTIADTLPVQKAPGSSAAQEPGSFSAPVPVEPAPGAVLSLARTPAVTLGWKPVPGASGYEVTLSVLEAGQPRTLMSWTTPGESVRVDLSSLPVPGAFLWDVTAVKSNLLFAEERSSPGRSRFSVTK